MHLQSDFAKVTPVHQGRQKHIYIFRTRLFDRQVGRGQRQRLSNPLGPPYLVDQFVNFALRSVECAASQTKSGGTRVQLGITPVVVATVPSLRSRSTFASTIGTMKVAQMSALHLTSSRGWSCYDCRTASERFVSAMSRACFQRRKIPSRHTRCENVCTTARHLWTNVAGGSTISFFSVYYSTNLSGSSKSVLSWTKYNQNPQTAHHSV